MEEKKNKVIDFTEFPTTSEEDFILMDDDLFQQYEMYCDFIQLATALPEGASTESDYHCPNVLVDGERCEGDIEVSRSEQPRQVQWKCNSCGYDGTIVNYEKSDWDNTELTDNEKQAFLTGYSAFSGDMEYYQDMMFDYDEEMGTDLLEDFEYYLNPYDPEGLQSGSPSTVLIEEMLNCDWEDPDSPVYLRDDLPYSELEPCDFFYNARQFLLTLQEVGEFELTRNKLLKRKDVKRLLSKTRWPQGQIEILRKYQEHIDETDVWILHGLRLLVDIAGLTNQTDDNKYVLHTARQDLLKEENAGKLYRTLFSAYFNEMDMAFLGTNLEIPHLQHSIPFIIYQLTVHAREWTVIEELLPEILLFSVKVELENKNFEDIDLSKEMLSEDLFASLERFNLVETQRVSESDPDDIIEFPDQVRITPLMDKFVEFNLDRW